MPYCAAGLMSWVLPLHEVKSATAVKVVRYGNPFVRIHRIFDFSICLANRASDSQGIFLGGIVQSPEGLAGCVDPMYGRYTASFTRLSKEFYCQIPTRNGLGG
jgi:hypothetical protein